MPQDDVKVIGWPSQPAQLEHQFVGGTACPVQISFDKTPANVTVQATAQDPVHVDMNMNMNLMARNTIPVCIEVCKPICVQSEYTIGIEIFDRPVALITLRGQTRIFNCDEKS
ncbi:MAG: hypothetical protein ABSC63_18920 [Candidatus Binataceae bacterium]|jgi:hypothetical protein